MKGLTKLVEGFSYSSATFILSCLTRFWTHLCLNSQQVLSILYSDLRLCTRSGILPNLAYSEPCLFRDIQVYTGIFNNNSYNKISFLFSFTYFSKKFKKTCFLTTLTSISMLDRFCLNNTQSVEITLQCTLFYKLPFFSSQPQCCWSFS